MQLNAKTRSKMEATFTNGQKRLEVAAKVEELEEALYKLEEPPAEVQEIMCAASCIREEVEDHHHPDHQQWQHIAAMAQDAREWSDELAEEYVDLQLTASSLAEEIEEIANEQAEVTPAWTGNILDAGEVADWVRENLSESHRGVIRLDGRLVIYDNAARLDIAQHTVELMWSVLRNVPGCVVTDFHMHEPSWILLATPPKGKLDIEALRKAIWDAWTKATKKVLPGEDTRHYRAVEEQVALETELEVLGNSK